MKSIFTLFLVSAALFVSAQQNTFKVKSFSQGGNNYLSKLTELNDGSFVAVGDGYDSTLNTSIYLLKTDAQGTVLASKLFTVSDNDYGTTLVKTTDGGFVISGVLDSKPALVKFNADLSIQWQRRYDFGDDIIIEPRAVVQTADGGYTIGGLYDSLGDTETSYNFFFKTDSLGAFVLSKKYFANLSPDNFDMVLMADGNYGLLAESQNETNDTLRVMKIQPDGSVLWARKFYYKSADMELLYLKASSDGGLVVTGTVFMGNADNTQLMMLKYNSTGGLAWSKTLVSSGNSELDGYDVTEDRDGGYVFAGDYNTYTADDAYDTSYGYLAKTDAAGNLLWTKTFEPSHDGYTEPSNMILTKDGGYAMCGGTGFFNADTAVLEDGSFIYKLDGSFAACGEIPGSAGTLRTTGSSATDAIVPENVTAANDTISASLSDFGVIINECSSNALPVQLLSFDAKLQGRSVGVNWTTANEVNTDYFVVERSADKRSFEALQRVTAKGTSSATQLYSISDLQPLSGTSYYRLKEVDKDGKTTYSSIVPVTVMSNGTVVISPNPVQSVMHVIVQSTTNNNLTLQVIDMKGNVLATKKKAVVGGRNAINIAASSLARGVYILKVTDSKTAQAIRFVKE